MEDYRIRTTKKLIRESLIKLLEEKPINKITVTELCTECQINRATFYRYYEDVYDLLDQLEKQLVLELKSGIQLTRNDYTISGFTEEILEVLLRNKELSRMLFNERSGKDFLRDILEIAHNKCMEEWKRSDKDIPKNKIDYLCTFITGGTIGILNEWMTNDFKETPREIAELIENISHYGIKKIIY